MVERQVAARGISHEAVLQAMRDVPREAFIAADLAEFAYVDAPLPIAEGQTISQPYIVALMAEALELKPGDRVLEVGAGSGYAAAILGKVAKRVITVERHRALAESAAAALRGLGYDNVDVHHADGSLGWVDSAPYEAILVTAAPSRIWQKPLDPLSSADIAGCLAQLGRLDLDRNPELGSDATVVGIVWHWMANVVRGRGPLEYDLLGDHIRGFRKRTMRRWRRQTGGTSLAPAMERIQRDQDLVGLLRKGYSIGNARRWLQRHPRQHAKDAPVSRSHSVGPTAQA